ncbi:MAG: hypothetical protein JO264_21080 [Acidisphaera sp.]|nr:hypothetical protein [Acidisphaera sp.]
MRRRLVLLLPLLAAGCVVEAPPPPPNYVPPSYAYLTPLRLRVASIEIGDDWQPSAGGADLSPMSPLPPVDALRRMAQDRLVAAGNSGRAVFTIEDAAIVQTYAGLSGHFEVRLDIYTSGETRAAYAEASVARTLTEPPGGAEALQPALYSLTRQMMDDMNVELEYQVRHSLADWLENSSAASPVPVPVQQQPLPPP